MTHATATTSPSPRALADRFQVLHESGIRGDELAKIRSAFLAAVKDLDRERAAHAAREAKAVGGKGTCKIAYMPRDLSTKTGSPLGGWYDVLTLGATTPHYGFQRLESHGAIYPAGDPPFIARRSRDRSEAPRNTLAEAATWILNGA